MSRLLAAISVLVLALGAAACGDDKKDTGDKDKAKSTSTSAASGASAATGATADAPPPPARCRNVAKPKPKTGKAAKASRPTLQLDPKVANDVVLVTSCGQITIRLDAKRAPKTAASFASLARSGFYDDVIFHRVSPGFVIQGGDPQGTGMGGPGYQVVEPPPTDLTYGRGVVAMAKTQVEDPGTSGSQFFIVTVEDSGLDPQYALVGKVIQGLDAVDLIAATQIDPATEQPVKPVVIESATLKSAKPAASRTAPKR